MESLILSPDHLVLAGAVQSILMYSFRTLFFLSAVLLMVIVLLQEGKGGGLASALGGQGAETFGVASGGVNKVTLFLAGLFLLSALGHALTTESVIQSMRRTSTKTAPPKEEQGNGMGIQPPVKEVEPPVKEVEKTPPVKDAEKTPPVKDEKTPPPPPPKEGDK
jgi:preprotein translocase subunit SecG